LFLWQQQKGQEVLRRRLSESSSKRKCSTRQPPVGEQLVELVLGASADTGKGIPQVGEWIDAQPIATSNEAGEHSPVRPPRSLA
jgi:hypothetical protein